MAPNPAASYKPVLLGHSSGATQSANSDSSSVLSDVTPARKLRSSSSATATGFYRASAWCKRRLRRMLGGHTEAKSAHLELTCKETGCWTRCWGATGKWVAERRCLQGQERRRYRA
jgi:hypothetical protein